ncbi:MAG: ABC transporter ATP-binding protein [Anaerolineae bacterium]|jgi:oligopeptide/dipeptide ABC transporter ATP-binding protein
MALLEVRGLTTCFFLRRGIVQAVNDVSFSVNTGETLGLVGESGSGKSITSLSILRLVPAPGRILSGTVTFDGVDLLALSEKEMRKYRGCQLSMILQDPLSSLNPVFSIGDQVGEGIVIHDNLKGNQLRQRVVKLLRWVGIPAAEARVDDYPHQFSGGMRQRVVGAVCLACRPRFLIADEPTTSLDVTIQMQYLNLLKDIQKREQLAMLFVTHDFGIVAKMCDHVAVMYAGRIVERAEVRAIFDRPLHPYTKALMSSVPKVEERVERLVGIEGQPPTLLNLPPGCSFLPRCPEKTAKCSSEEFPPEIELAGNHSVRCWHYV